MEPSVTNGGVKLAQPWHSGTPRQHDTTSPSWAPPPVHFSNDSIIKSTTSNPKANIAETT
jgi:hypothetical protein